MAALSLLGFFSTMIYPNLEYKGYPSTHNCTGECYEEYVRVHGTVVEQLKRQQAEAAEDPLVQLEDYGQVVLRVMEARGKVWQYFQHLQDNQQII